MLYQFRTDRTNRAFAAMFKAADHDIALLDGPSIAELVLTYLAVRGGADQGLS